MCSSIYHDTSLRQSWTTDNQAHDHWVQHNRTRWAREYLKTVPPAVGGRRFRDRTAAIVARGFGLDFNEAVEVLSPYGLKCIPAWRGDQLYEDIYWALRSDLAKGFALQWSIDSDPIGFDPCVKCRQDPCTCERFEDIAPRDPSRRRFGSTQERLHFEAEEKRREAEERDREVLSSLDRFKRQHHDDMGKLNAATLIEKLRSEKFPCEKQTTIIFEVERDDGEFEGLVIRPRCKSWSCQGCAAKHRMEYVENFKRRLRGDGPAWRKIIDSIDTDTVTKAIRRAGGNYFWFDTVKGREIVSNVAIAGGKQITCDLAAEYLSGIVWAHEGSKRPNWRSSRDWCLPKRKPSTLTKKLIGVIDHDDRNIQEVVAVENVLAESTGVNVEWKNHIRERYRIRMKGKTKRQRQRVFDRLADVPVHQVKYRWRGDSDYEMPEKTVCPTDSINFSSGESYSDRPPAAGLFDPAREL